MWTLLLDATLDGELGSAAQLGMIDDNGSIRIFYVVQSALGKAAVFLKRIAFRNSAEFIETAGRTPAAAIDSMSQRRIKRRAIHTGLPAGNNFHDKTVRHRFRPAATFRDSARMD